ncbi:exodeoxyribonuclease III [Treponema phagedenis]|uniref:Exodeoxyribonuclease n=1 Tax=Treponema phagedenis TaxID=162 RepID=A0A0B7GZ74_TREPH|nr:exodeoxyribonuclease III [Treponema phagedenis]EFW38423.1 exodeoxyribonuclease III [Treponema phagedenis F0421]NVP25531.1 exodeoxyribonuclease III [Treponema phagedenis]QEJ95925.1 exodeoxyribonuclease III [Treponema phagedenis]QEJ97331.1 exodeoxyribonuclease III [Treponema phagedenis]QEK00376.1 exodeoxyribonuclease III [Treponema phagedenis]
MLNIISWNVNGIRAVEKKGFADWLYNESPDILCLQEIKARKEQVSGELLAPVWEGGTYKTFWQPAKRPGYSGTALFTKKEPDNIRIMDLEEFDSEGRVIAADFGKLTVISAYFPNSQDAGARLAYKLEFCAAMREFCDNLQKEGQDVILCGDYNIAHKPIDLANPKTNEKNPGYLPEEREWMDVFTGAGYVDTFRHFCAEPEHYTWWTYRFKARERNVGWRIDYHCVNEDFLPKVKSSIILKDVFGSDHCPIKLSVSN